MRPIDAVLLTLAVCFVCPVPSRAQSSQSTQSISVPRLINISGVYRPADGPPSAAVETVTLAIYAEETGGAPLWQETQSVQLDAAGRYSLMLGATESNGVPLDVFASGEARWLGLVWTRPGDVEGPRMQFTSVPYALRATDAETLGGLPASAYMVAPTGNGKAGSRSGKAATSGGTAENSLETTVNPLSVLPGTTNALAKYVNAADVGASAVSEVSGRVGINTGGALPADYLHVRFTDPFGAFTGLAVQNLSNAANASSGMLFYDHNGALSQFQGFNNTNHAYVINNIASNASINFMTGNISRFLVHPNGNIGIGTTNPAVSLEVSNATTGTPGGSITASTYSAGVLGSIFSGRKARGTFAAPTAVLSGDNLAMFRGFGYGTTNYGPGGAGMIVRATETWTDTANGTSIRFFTTPNGLTTSGEVITIHPSGGFCLGCGGLNPPSSGIEIVRNTTAQYTASAFGVQPASQPVFLGRAARGLAAAPTAALQFDALATFAGAGYGTTGFSGSRGGMTIRTVENWTDTAQGTEIIFSTTPFGSTVQAEVMRLNNVGNLVIGVAAPLVDRLTVVGDIRVGTSGTNGCLKDFSGTGIVGTCASDLRFKKDITPVGQTLGALSRLQPVHYSWRATEFPEKGFGDVRALGLIAQDVEEVLPELVVTGDDGYKAVDYSKLPLLTIQAVKELKAENDALKLRVGELDSLMTENDGLKDRVAELERLVTELLVTTGRR